MLLALLYISSVVLILGEYQVSFNELVYSIISMYRTAQTIATQFPGHGGMDDLKTERNFYLQATLVIGVLGLYIDMLPKGACITRHSQTSGRMVNESNVCTVWER